MAQRKRINQSDRDDRLPFLQVVGTRSAQSESGRTPYLHSANTKGKVAQRIGIFLVTPSKSTEALLRHAFTSWGYGIRNRIEDISEPTFRSDMCGPTVVVLDYAILHRDGDVNLPDWLQAGSSNYRILVFGARILDCAKRLLLEAGVHGYLALPEDLHFLAKAITEVASGGLWYGRSVLNIVILGGNFRRNPATKAGVHQVTEKILTRQERIVADCVGQGLSNGEIASKLSISIKTVKLHLTRVYRKLEVSNRVQLTLLVRRDSSASEFIAALRCLTTVSKISVTELLPDVGS